MEDLFCPAVPSTEQAGHGRLIGDSPAIRHVYRLIERAGPTDASVLITGESGTGKELVAQAIHAASPRAAAPMIAVHCAAIPESLLESELFGHERGAFTDAVEARAGCFELADGGTLFLDEIAETPPSTQVKLLRALEEGTVRRVGSFVQRRIDVRIIAATNREPLEAIAAGLLRGDLYYRLNVVDITLPPLRARRTDIALLARAFLAEAARASGTATSGITPDALDALCRHSWPGNVRELRNVIERAVILAQTAELDVEHLKRSLHGSPAAPSRCALAPGMTIADADRRLIELTLEHTSHNKTHAARLLGISVKTLYNKLSLYRELDRRRARPDAPATGLEWSNRAAPSGAAIRRHPGGPDREDPS